MDTYPLLISTPEGTAYEKEVESIVVPGQLGSFGVLAHHAPMIAAVADGPMTIQEPGGGKTYYAVGKGVLEVSNEKVLMLSGFARHKSGLDEAKSHLEADDED